MNSNNKKFWILGEEEIITPSSKNLGKILLAIITHKGRLLTSFSNELRDGKWIYPTVSCSIILGIELPADTEDLFMNDTGFTLTEPQVIGV
jgi:hypothetical protein